MLLHLGYPATPGTVSGRRPIDQVLRTFWALPVEAVCGERTAPVVVIRRTTSAAISPPGQDGIPVAQVADRRAWRSPSPVPRTRAGSSPAALGGRGGRGRRSPVRVARRRGVRRLGKAVPNRTAGERPDRPVAQRRDVRGRVLTGRLEPPARVDRAAEDDRVVRRRIRPLLHREARGLQSGGATHVGVSEGAGQRGSDLRGGPVLVRRDDQDPEAARLPRDFGAGLLVSGEPGGPLGGRRRVRSDDQRWRPGDVPHGVTLRSGHGSRRCVSGLCGPGSPGEDSDA
jgi:hypothetical protein